ncbi:MAG: HzsA-related protein, partial [Thermoguttaceae bacterium]
FPPVFNVARAVPGSNHLFAAIGAPHMPLGVGTLLLVDTRADRRTGEGVTYLTPEVDTQHQWGWDNLPGGATRPIPPEMQEGRDGRGNTSRGPLYMDPYPISSRQILVSFNPHESWNVENAYALFLLGPDGVKRLLHKDPESSCWMPIPVRPRTKPGIPRATVEPELARQGLARVVVTDVYRGLDGVPRGTVKYLRINEHVPRPWAARRTWDGDVYDQQHSVISCNAALGLRVQHGIVPVEEDGSAHFLVEADKNLFLQALDADFAEVQRERTFVNYRPGEVRGCVGCHERAKDDNSVQMAAPPHALSRAPSTPGPQPGEPSGARPLAYEVDVQPVWDRHCVSCHNAQKKDGGLDLAGERTELFCRSYENILARGLVSIIGENHPKAGNNHYLPPYSLGTYASKLTAYLKPDHYQVQLSNQERIRVTTWIDSNGQYYGSYYGRKNLRYAAEPDFRPVLTFGQSHANTPPGAEAAR